MLTEVYLCGILYIMLSVAVVDDEKNIRNLISQALAMEDFSVKEFSDGEAAWLDFMQSKPDILILDVMMPRLNGLELCRKIREIDQAVPVIFLSSRDEEFDRVLGLDAGADDYVCKPFSLMELTARIKAAARRLNTSAEPVDSCYDIKCGKLNLSTEDLSVEWDGAEIRLSVTEFRILSRLAESPGTVKTREQLMAAAFPDDSFINERAADSHIKRIRRKIREEDPGAVVFEAVYGLGYRLVLPE